MKHILLGLGLFLLTLSNSLFAAEKKQDYPLTIEIIGFESNPYTTSGGTHTSCSDYGNGVNCSSSPYTWRHVQNTMAALINGQKYVLACTASVRWSKCRPLNMGTYRGRQVKHGIEIVSYDEKGKPHPATYAVVGGTAASPPTSAPAVTGVAAPTVPPPAGGATIAVSSTPAGADIILDGAFAGNTPSSIGVAPGEHTVRVVKKGYDEWERDIRTSTGIVNLAADLQPGNEHKQSTPTTVALHAAQQAPTSDSRGSLSGKEQVPETATSNAASASGHDTQEGTLSITSSPDGAEIFVDSVGRGHTPALVKVGPGAHSVQVVKHGYKDWVQQVSVTAGSISNVSATLTQ